MASFLDNLTSLLVELQNQEANRAARAAKETRPTKATSVAEAAVGGVTTFLSEQRDEKRANKKAATQAVIEAFGSLVDDHDENILGSLEAFKKVLTDTGFVPESFAERTAARAKKTSSQGGEFVVAMLDIYETVEARIATHQAFLDQLQLVTGRTEGWVAQTNAKLNRRLLGFTLLSPSAKEGKAHKVDHLLDLKRLVAEKNPNKQEDLILIAGKIKEAADDSVMAPSLKEKSKEAARQTTAAMKRTLGGEGKIDETDSISINIQRLNSLAEANTSLLKLPRAATVSDKHKKEHQHPKM